MTYIKRLPPVAVMLLASLTVLGTLVPTAGDAQETIVLNTVVETPQPLFADDEAEIRLQVANPPDDWERIVAAFGEDHQPAGLLLDSIADVKYRVDVTLFNAVELTSRLAHILEIRYSNGRFSYAHNLKINPSPLSRKGPFSLEDTRVKIDVAFNKGGPYAGIKVSFPFGN